MSKSIITLGILLVAFALIGLNKTWSQITTAQIQGMVTDQENTPLFGASIVIHHQPTGTIAGTITLENGRFTIPNLRIGGPYNVHVSYVGFDQLTMNDIYLALGDQLELDFTLLSNASSELSEVQLIASYDQTLLGKNKTGSSTEISSRQINRLPSISRSTSDYLRLVPSSDGNSFVGKNDRLNNFSLDGSVFNNPYGLDSAVPGGQSSAQPVSLDAIDQIQINVAPYDVTLAGFTGASVNAVTKSGANDFQGSVFHFFRNQDLTGIRVKEEPLFRSDLTHFQTGFTLGGPIIKNKAFFFTNLEIEQRSDLGSELVASRPGLKGERVSRVLASDLDLVSQTLLNRFDYQTGPYEKYNHQTENVKGLIKIDWNINQKHSLVTTYNFLDASRELPRHPNAGGRGGPDRITLQFFNSGYQITNRLHAGIVELKSNFNNRFSNNLQIGFTAFHDFRAPFSKPFPVVNINKNNIRYIVAGHEPFSIRNYVKQQVFQITNNLNIYLPNHNITVGGSFERFDFENSFNLGWYDPTDGSPPYPSTTFGPGFESVATFVDFVQQGHMDSVVQFAQNTHQKGDWKIYFMSVGQLSVYVQDRWQINRKLVFTVGFRLDTPYYFNSNQYAQDIIDTLPHDYDDTIDYFELDGNPIKFDNTQLPKRTPLLSPRFGFHWEMNQLGTSELRGGAGVFSGRIPFVWIGNQIGNPFWYFRQAMHPQFKFPQVFRINIGHDQLLGKGWSSTIDIMYTKDIHGMLVRNYGLNKPTGRLLGIDNRKIYTSDDLATYTGLGFPVRADIYVFTNTDVGSSFNSSLKIQKYWNSNTWFSLAYNYLVSKDANSTASEITSSAFNNNPAIDDVNQAISSHSMFGNKHRLIGTFNTQYEYGPWVTSIGVFAEYAQGGRFSYTYSGDINGDGSPNNDLIYVPTSNDIKNMRFIGTEDEQSTQRTALEKFIQQDPILKTQRGQYAKKYNHLLPWFSRWDMRILQDYELKNQNSIQLSIDILNLGNLISSNWGIRQRVTNWQPIGVTVDQNRPTYSFDTNLKDTFIDDFSLESRWQIQFGLRYRF
ncbi:MAG: carboxypeptidase regulatory-like domain-containing protein [Flavobacteriaceae bacterium]|nr:carboxypeptidase regulatory-like domain-containing protein [Flavobacteriaceae bacterium]